MGRLRREAILVVLFDDAGRFCGHRVLSDGRPASGSARFRDLFGQAFLTGASGFLLVHNHPSGDPRPSRQDIGATRSLAAVARVMEFEFLDHLVIAGNAATSMRRAGLIPERAPAGPRTMGGGNGSTLADTARPPSGRG